MMSWASWPDDLSEYGVRPKLHEGSSRICHCPALKMFSESLVAAIRKRRAATSQTPTISAVAIGHKRAVCGIVTLESRVLVAVF